jgi:hypothetical protein
MVQGSGAGSTSRWARAATGAIIGFIAGTFVGVLIACIALVVTLLAPGLGRAEVWRAAGVLIAGNYVVAIVTMAWRAAFRRAADRAQ